MIRLLLRRLVCAVAVDEKSRGSAYWRGFSDGRNARRGAAVSIDGDALESAAAAAYEVGRAHVANSHVLRDLDQLPPPWEQASEHKRVSFRAIARASVDAYAAHAALYGASS